jgi:hypothetical protein
VGLVEGINSIQAESTLDVVRCSRHSVTLALLVVAPPRLLIWRRVGTARALRLPLAIMG